MSPALKFHNEGEPQYMLQIVCSLSSLLELNGLGILTLIYTCLVDLAILDTDMHSSS